MSKMKQDDTHYEDGVCYKHVFTAEELVKLANVAGRKNQQVDEKESAIKANAAVAKSEVKLLKAELGELLHRMNNGCEERTGKCVVEFNRRRGTKKYILHAPGDPDNDMLVRECPMTEADYGLLPMDEKLPEKKKAKEEPAKPEQPPQVVVLEKAAATTTDILGDQGEEVV